MSIQLSFQGATDTVTGSRYLVETGGARVLVDCGLFQGPKKLRERNWRAPSFEPSSLDAVLLTHAHIDHSGYLPKLCKDGFRGPIWCTDGTRDLLRILLPDAGHLQEEDARHANKYGYSRHRPALPLYTREDAESCLAQLRAVAFHEVFEPTRGVTASYTRAGHIVGSGCLALAVAGTRLTFSGDVGRPADPVMRPPEPLGPTDYLVIESTYGDRRHPREDVAAALATLVSETAARGGTIVVPAFAVGRAQHLLHLLAGLRAAERIPPLPVFLDSPMAVAATDLFCKHRDDQRLSEAECTSMSAASASRFASRSCCAALMSCGRAPGAVDVQAARRIVASRCLFIMLSAECIRRAGSQQTTPSIESTAIRVADARYVHRVGVRAPGAWLRDRVTSVMKSAALPSRPSAPVPAFGRSRHLVAQRLASHIRGKWRCDIRDGRGDPVTGAVIRRRLPRNFGACLRWQLGSRVLDDDHDAASSCSPVFGASACACADRML